MPPPAPVPPRFPAPRFPGHDAHALAEQGLTPPGVDDPEVFGARAA
ncbi:MAG: hypothetical protein JO057_09815 [Chloroflexi bacterium]|nr:hypothetical protein [Chloroflexota bacterium]